MLEEYKDIKFKKDSIVMITRGEYSDYGVTGLFTVLKTFTPVNELEKYLELYPEQKEDYKFKEDQFVAHMLGKGLLSEIVCNTLHTGDYDSIESIHIYGT